MGEALTAGRAGNRLARAAGRGTPAAPVDPDTAPTGFVTRGHGRAAAAVRAMILGRAPHALLISGPAGIGKTTLALDLAAGLLCDERDPAARPCRACRGCRLVERGRHPDVHRLAPGGAGDQIRIGSRERPEEGTVRRLASDLVLLPVEGGARVAIVERADRLTDDAQTALLKTLEEPPPGVTIVLCADDEDRLLPTVRSRCARIRLGPVATREIEAILAAGGVAEPPLAARLARIAAGRPGAAGTLARAAGALVARDELARILLDLVGQPIAARLAASRDIATLGADIARAIDRAAAGPTEAPPSGSGRRGSRAVPDRAGDAQPQPVAGPAGGAEAGAEDEAGPAGGVAADEEPGRGTVPAAERRRAAGVVVGVWRDLTRDLLVVSLGEERHVRDTAFLDEMRAASARLADDSARSNALASFLGRLDAAGELLEANVRPELVLDALVLRWPAAAGTDRGSVPARPGRPAR